MVSDQHHDPSASSSPLTCVGRQPTWYPGDDDELQDDELWRMKPPPLHLRLLIWNESIAISMVMIVHLKYWDGGDIRILTTGGL